ncbi:MAG: hypothetical protein ACRCS6_01965 [Turicibacter sp.]
MENKSIEKIYFVPGNLVIVKHGLENKPIMLVTEIVTSRIVIPTVTTWGGVGYSSDATSPVVKQACSFRGIRCGWFDRNSVWQEQIFSTKDLIKVEEGE